MPTKLVAIAALALLAQQEPTATVEKGTLAISLEIEGSFEPVAASDIRLRPEVLGSDLRVAEVRAVHGQAVRAGDVLLRLETPHAADLVTAAEADAVSAKAACDRAETDLKLSEQASALALLRARREKELAEEKLKLFKDVDEPLARAASDQGLKRSQDYIDDQREELAQLEKMYKSEELTNATAEIVVRRARRTLDRALFELDQTKIRAKKLREVELPNQLDQLTRELAQKKLDLEEVEKLAPFGRVQKEAELTRARLNAKKQAELVEKLKKDLEALTIRAPSDGTLFFGRCQKGKWEGVDETIHALRAGEKVAPPQVVLTIAGDKLSFRAEVAEADLGKVKMGMSASLAPVAYPDLKFSGPVASVSPTSGGGGFELKVKADAASNRLAAGMRAKASILVEKLEGVLLVPSSFIVEENGKKLCYLKSGPKEVETGKSNGKMTQIVGGLSAGDVLVMPKK